MTCLVDGCTRPVHTAKLCRAHYKRKQRHGDPTKGRSFVGDAPALFRNVVLNHTGPECFLWPLCRDPRGYGLVSYQGKTMGVHRAVCIEVYGPPQLSGSQATHSCGNGHLGCCSPSHLTWGTAKSNAEDMKLHGITAGPDRLLSEADEEDILLLKQQGLSYACISRRLGYGASTISRAYHRAKVRRS